MNKEFMKLNMAWHGFFTALVMVMSLTGGLGNAASVCYKRLASFILAKRDVPYTSTMACI